MVNIFFTLLVLAYLFASVTLAQDATPSTTRKERLQQKIEAKKERIENKATAVKEKMATREAALKAKLEKFKDKKKAEIADRVNTNLNKINQKQTEQMQKHLDKMSVLLDKLEARVVSGKPDVKDSTAAKAAIAAARSSIASATAAVKLQVEKDYTLTVTSESKVKVDAQKARDQLRTDLQALRIQVIEAKQTVGNAIRVAKSGKVEVPREGTPSGQ